MAAPLKAILDKRRLIPRQVSIAAGLPGDTIRNIFTGRAKRPSSLSDLTRCGGLG